MKRRSWTRLSRLQAKDVMSTDIVSLTPETSVRKALDLLTRRRITGVPVVNEAGTPIGVFSLSDIARAGRRERDLYYSSADYEDIGEIADVSRPAADLEFSTVGDLMNPLVIVAVSSDSLAQVARVMARRRVHRVLIMDKGRIAGVVSSMDLVQAFAQAGTGLERRLRRVRPHRSASRAHS